MAANNAKEVQVVRYVNNSAHLLWVVAALVAQANKNQ
jgi:hypothetical protein